MRSTACLFFFSCLFLSFFPESFGFQFCTSYDFHVTGPYAVCSRVIIDLFSDFAKPFTSAVLRDFKSECF